MNPNLKVWWGLRFHTGGLGRVTGMRSMVEKSRKCPRKTPHPTVSGSGSQQHHNHRVGKWVTLQKNEES